MKCDIMVLVWLHDTQTREQHNDGLEEGERVEQAMTSN